MHRFLPLLLLLVPVACGQPPSPCATNSDCDRGMRCVGGDCVPAGDGGHGGDSGIPDAGPTGTCSACTSNAACAAGSVCAIGSDGAGHCAPDCSAASGTACDTGTGCQSLTAASNGAVKACLPASCGGCGDTWSSYAQGFFNDHCTRCHGGPDQTWPQSDPRVRASIAAGSMPRGETLAQSERDRITAWIDCGAN